MSQLENTTNQSLDRAFRLIEILANGNVAMSLMEISRELGVTRTTAYALVNSLLNQHCLERNESTKKYMLGYRFYEIGAQYRYRFPFLSIAEKYANPMFEKWNVRINFAVLKPEAKSVILMSKDSSLLPRMPHGQVLFANSCSSGKALLAFHDPEIVEHWLQTLQFPKFTPNTIVEPQELRWELEKIREQGFATEVEELSLRRACVAAPVRDMAGSTIAAVSFATTLQHYLRNSDELIDDIIALGNDISADLGYNLLSRG